MKMYTALLLFCQISNYANIYWSILIAVLTNEISERFVRYKQYIHERLQ